MNKETKRGLSWLMGIALALTLMFSPVAGLLGFTGMAFAATSQNITINATPGWVSISNTPSTYAFGTISASTNKNTTVTGFNVTNGGSVSTNITIGCNGWTNLTGTHLWTYGAPASDTSELNFQTTGSFPGTVVPNGSTVSLKTGLTAGASQTWGLEIEAPTAFTHGDQQQTTVTLTGTAA